MVNVGENCSKKQFLRLTYSYADGNRVTPTQLIGTGLVKARCIYSAGSNGRKVFTIHSVRAWAGICSSALYTIRVKSQGIPLLQSLPPFQLNAYNYNAKCLEKTAVPFFFFFDIASKPAWNSKNREVWLQAPRLQWSYQGHHLSLWQEVKMEMAGEKFAIETCLEDT